MSSQRAVVVVSVALVRSSGCAGFQLDYPYIVTIVLAFNQTIHDDCQYNNVRMLMFLVLLIILLILLKLILLMLMLLMLIF